MHLRCLTGVVLLAASLLSAPAAAQAGATYTELILDASGSMYAKLPDGRSRITAAKDVLSDVVAGLPDDANLNVGLRVYGASKRAGDPGACEDSTLTVPMKGVARPQLLASVRGVNAQGATPIAFSLEQAIADFPESAGRKLIVLVTDGAESCSGSLRDVLAKLKAKNIELRVIGIDLSTRAAATFQGAQFENASSANALAAALGRAVTASTPAAATPATIPVTVRFTRGGQPASGGVQASLVRLSNSAATSLAADAGVYKASVPAGSYLLRVTDPQANPPQQDFPGITIASGGKNDLTIDLTPINPINLTVSEAGTAGGEVVVRFTGAPAGAAQAGHFLALALEGSDPGDYLAHLAASDSGAIRLRTPDTPGRLEARYYAPLPDGGLRLLAKSAPFTTAQAQVTIKPPASAPAGSTVSVAYTNPTAASDDWISIAKVGAPEGEYVTYAYVPGSGTARVAAPAGPGQYEVRYLTGQENKVLARAALTVTESIPVTITAPASAGAASQVQVSFSSNRSDPSDWIDIAKPGTPDGSYDAYQEVRDGKSVTLYAPATPGEYEVRYHAGGANETTNNKVLARSKLTVTAGDTLNVKLNAPASAPATSLIEVSFSSNRNDPGDWIDIAKPGTPDGTYSYYVEIEDRKSVKINAPGEPGTYEVRYHAGGQNSEINNKVLARSTISVTASTIVVRLTAPASVQAGSDVKVSFTPAFTDDSDWIDFAKPGTPDGEYDEYVYVSDGNGTSVTLKAPEAPGTYELRYHAGGKNPAIEENKVLARVTVTVTP